MLDATNIKIYLKKYILIILGNNGAGKSTTLDIITGILPPSEEDVILFDTALFYSVELMQRHLVVCWQNDALYDDFSIEEHLHLMCKITNQPKDLIED